MIYLLRSESDYHNRSQPQLFIQYNTFNKSNSQWLHINGHFCGCSVQIHHWNNKGTARLTQQDIAHIWCMASLTSRCTIHNVPMPSSQVHYNSYTNTVHYTLTITYEQNAPLESLPCDAMHSVYYAVARCQSACLSVTAWYSVKMAQHARRTYDQIFFNTSSHITLVFAVPNDTVIFQWGLP